MGMAYRFPQLGDEEWLRRKYVDDGLSAGEVAAEIGCSRSRVEQRLHDIGITLRGRHYGRWTAKVCERCDATYTPSGPAQRFCGQRCARGVRECAYCGSEFLMSLANGTNTYCSRRCHYDHKAATGKGRRYVNGHGYVIVVAPPGTPGTTIGNRMPEHRYVLQEALGRPLRASETVHHINGDKTDNRLENLQLRQGRHGKGARFVCQDCGSHNVEAASI